MNRILAALTTLLFTGLAFAEEAEQPMETAGTGTVIAFLVICIAMAWAFVYFTRKSSRMTDEERAGDKLK